ncbi:probable disease resistance protein At5g66900 [Prosopis cineraria]|uniref:probable disease resistance protein At5g66900 n=1 Tax=Prosopis cineraria TaxID=364024 RepID=UPI00240F8FB2|nr:probable disease resistance protein At5g66900 [Prosopis cineraria]
MSTDQNAAPEWFKNQAAGAVVLILNLKAREFKLPESIKRMRNLRVLILTNYGVEYQTEFTNPGLLASLGKLRRIRLQQVSLPYPCKLKNVRKLSLYMCKVREAFEDNSLEFSKAMPSLVELNIDYCKDLERLPAGFCNITTMKKLSISSCHKFVELPQEIWKLEKLELLRISHCAEFKEMPESITWLKSLIFLDISYCIKLEKLPDNLGELRSLKQLYMTNCPVNKLPESVVHMEQLEIVICDENTYVYWEDIKACLNRGLYIKKAAQNADLNFLF